MTITLHEVRLVRNGISGQPYWTVDFNLDDQEDESCRMYRAVVFEEEGCISILEITQDRPIVLRPERYESVIRSIISTHKEESNAPGLRAQEVPHAD